MIKIRLETQDCRFVCVGTIPPFRTLPEVVIWGERVFRRHVPIPGSGEPERELPVYREAFTVALVTPVSFEEQP
jgi:hypothetical protein